MMYTVGDKVIIIGKSYYGSLSSSGVYKQIKTSGQEYGYITRIKHDNGDYYVVSDVESNFGGDYFREKDLLPYTKLPTKRQRDKLTSRKAELLRLRREISKQIKEINDQQAIDSRR
jgi:hypothetical protein